MKDDKKEGRNKLVQSKGNMKKISKRIKVKRQQDGKMLLNKM